MAKINHNNFINTINEVSLAAKNMGILHLQSDDEVYTGKHLNIGGQDLINFGTCGYLGLETDERLKQGAINFVQKYGTQFSVSRTYLTSSYNQELEDLLEKIYGLPVIVYSSTSTAHISVIPTLLDSTHAIILDQQVHMCVQTAAQLMVPKGIPVEMIRHSNMEMLERKLQELGNRYTKVWYMVDGVYSMFGDTAPLEQLAELMKKYENLCLYVDDAHGMSWYGPKGCGYLFTHMGVSDRVLLISTLAKGFGCVGGFAVLPDRETQQKVKFFGGPLAYSHPLAPAVIGSAIESAKIHLTDEINTMQMDLVNKINYANNALEATDLLVLSDPRTPIFFIGMGPLPVGYNVVRRMMQEGFFVNIALFPVVPAKNTGVRFTMTRHQEFEHISQMVERLSYHYPLALAEEGYSDNDVRRLFKQPLKKTPSTEVAIQPTISAVNISEGIPLSIEYHRFINELNAQEWNSLFADRGNMDAKGLAFIEAAFSGNEKPEENWNFHYLLVRNPVSGKVITGSYFTTGLYKDDLIAPEKVSAKIEEKRKEDPYYLSSKTVAMGSLLTEGEHLYLDRSDDRWKEALKLLLKQINQLEEQEGCEVTILRDFDANDIELRNLLTDEGFLKVDMPASNIIYNMTWKDTEDYLNTLTPRSKRHLKYEAIRHFDKFTHEIVDALPEEDLDYYYSLYREVMVRNLAVNEYAYPKKMLQEMGKSSQWEFMLLYLKPEHHPNASQKPVAFMCCYKGENHYAPTVIGMDYNYVFDFKSYKQILYRTVLRAKDLGFSRVHMGLTADVEKKKVGATALPRLAFVQARDNYHFEVIESISAT